ncbi:MAG: hypothetical protein V1495_07775 [Pseudomonadota bacterium]
MEEGAASLIVRELQRLLERIYRLGAQPPIEHFLISAADLRSWLPEGADPKPQILIQEADGEVFLAVHLAPEGLEPKNLADFLSAAEETSHFVYLLWRAANEKPVSLLDLELQGEIDKFLLASAYFDGESDLFARIFGKFSWLGKLSEEAKARYAEAQRLGGKFVRSLGAIAGGVGPTPGILRSLREFYRLGSQKRVASLARP